MDLRIFGSVMKGIHNTANRAAIYNTAASQGYNYRF